MADLTFYKAQLRQIIAEDPAVDPIQYYQKKYNIVPVRHAKPPEFLAPPLATPQEAPPTQFEFGLQDMPAYLSGDEDAVKRAIGDHYQLFERFYLPQLLSEEAYKKPGARRREFPGGWRLVDGVGNTDKLAAYVNPGLGKNYVAFRGTRLTNPGDLVSDTALLLAGRVAEGPILAGADREAEALFNAYPELKWDVTGHSLGGSRANIVQHYYPDEVEHAHLFNMGLSPIHSLTGWSPYESDRSTHFHVTQDPISAPYVGDKMERYHASMRGGPAQGFLREGAGMAPGTLLMFPKYHGLDAFKDRHVDQAITQAMKGENSRGHYLTEKQAERIQYGVHAMNRGELLKAARSGVNARDRNALDNMDNQELRQVVAQLAYIGRKVFKHTRVNGVKGDALKSLAFQQQELERGDSRTMRSPPRQQRLERYFSPAAGAGGDAGLAREEGGGGGWGGGDGGADDDAGGDAAAPVPAAFHSYSEEDRKIYYKDLNAGSLKKMQELFPDAGFPKTLPRKRGEQYVELTPTQLGELHQLIRDTSSRTLIRFAPRVVVDRPITQKEINKHFRETGEKLVSTVGNMPAQGSATEAIKREPKKAKKGKKGGQSRKAKRKGRK